MTSGILRPDSAIEAPRVLVRPRFGGVGTERQLAWMGRMVWAVLFLNVVDGVLTLHWISNGLAFEANPMLADLAHNHPFWFVVTKMSLVALGSVILFRNRHRASAVVAIFAAFLAYYGVLLIHLRALNANLADRVAAWVEQAGLIFF